MTAPTETDAAGESGGGFVAADQPDLAATFPARTVGADDYEVVGELAAGGMGRILRAWDRRHDRPVAIKVLLRAGADAARRFAREARLTARLQHPSIVPLHEMGRWSSGEPFYVMKLVEGRSLADAAADARTPNERLALLPHLIAATEALAYAHGQRVIHRDLKPANVLVGPFGETVVIDWGLAKDLAAPPEPESAPAPAVEPNAPELTRAGSVVGTIGYMPPEQARGERVDERADVFALGALAYHVLSGHAPYVASTPAQVMALVRAGGTTPLRREAPHVPRDLAAIVDKAMAQRAADRYPTAEKMAADLRAFAAGGLVSAYSYSIRELFRRWAARHRALVTASAVFVVVLAAVVAVSLVVLVRANRRAEAHAAEARARLMDALEEQGRRLVLAGDHRRGLGYLAEAYAGGARGAGMRYLLARAIHAVAAEKHALRHSSAVAWATFAPDGRRIATAADDGTAAVWDATTGERLVELRGHAGPLARVEWSPDGRALVTSSWDRTARVWDAAGGLRATLGPHGDDVHSAVFSSDGGQVLTSSLDGKARLWDATDGRLLVTYPGKARVDVALFAAAGRRIVTAGQDGKARIWDVDGTLVKELGHEARRVRMAVSADGGTIATASGQTLSLWTAEGAPRAAFVHAREVGRPTLSADGAIAAVGDEGATTSVYDVRVGRILHVLPGGRGPVEWTALSPDGMLIATVSTDRTIQLWDLRSGEALSTLVGHDDDVFSVSFDPSSRLLVTSSVDHTARIWDARAGQRAAVFRAGHDGVEFADVSADGSRLALAGADGTLDVRDAKTGTALAALPGAYGCARFTRDGARVLLPIREAKAAAVVEVATGRRTLELRCHTDAVIWAEFSPDETVIVTAAADGTARLWDASSGRAVRTLAGHAGKVLHASFSADGARVATSGEDGTAVVWKVTSGERVVTVAGTNYMNSARFDPTGRRLVTASANKTARVWDAETGRPLMLLEDHQGPINFAMFDPSGQRVVTASEDGTARIWEVNTGRLLGVLPHRGPVTSAVFGPDGATVVTASRDDAVRVWDTGLENRPAADVLALAACRVPAHFLDEKLPTLAASPCPP
jgi:WD40 repeat protein